MQRPYFSRAFATMVVLSLTAAGIAGGTACSIVTNTTALQCRSDNECQALGPEFSGFACDLPTHTCVKVAEDADLCVATPGKSANRSCMDKFNGDPAICSPKSHKCVRLKTPECPEIVERRSIQQAGAFDLENDNTVVVGLVDGRNCCLGLGNISHYFAQLALEQVLQANSQGIPASGGGPARPMVLLVCPEGQPGRLDAIARAGKHLANDVEVPLVVGPFQYDDINVMYSQGLRDKRIPLILPGGQSRSDLQALPNPAAPTPLLYDIHPSAAEIVEMYRELIISQLEPRIRSSPGFSGDIRVAMITERALAFREPEELFEKRLVFNNGKSVAQNQVPDSQGKVNYLKVAISDTTDPIANPNPKAEAEAALDAIVKFKPHIVIHNLSITLPPIELFPLLIQLGSDPSLFKAYHFDVAGGVFGFPDTIKVLNAVQYPKGRVLAWAAHRDAADVKRAQDTATDVRRQFIADPLAAGPVAVTPVNQTYYDSVFLAAYMIGAVGNKPLTAENFAAAIPRLTAKGGDAKRINTGLTDSAVGFAALASGQSIDLQGITSTFDIDPASGAVKYDSVEAWCIDAAGNPLPSGFYSTQSGSAGDITKCE